MNQKSLQKYQKYIDDLQKKKCGSEHLNNLPEYQYNFPIPIIKRLSYRTLSHYHDGSRSWTQGHYCDSLDSSYSNNADNYTLKEEQIQDMGGFNGP